MTRGKERPVPAWVDALDQIGNSDLKPILREMLRTMLRWWNPKTDELYPALSTVARHMNRDIKTVRIARRKLEQLGVLELIERSDGGVTLGGRGRTHRMRLHLDRLNPGDPPGKERVENPGDTPAEPRSSIPQTRVVGPPNPGDRPGEPSIHLTSEQATEPCEALSTPPAECMDGAGASDVKVLLERAGVKGPNLQRLAAWPGVTPEVVKSELEGIRAAKGIRNVPAVLVTRLAERFGIESVGPKRDCPKTLDALAKVEARRRDLGIPSQTVNSKHPLAQILGYGES